MNNNNYDVTLLNFQTADELHVGLEWKLTNLRYILVVINIIDFLIILEVATFDFQELFDHKYSYNILKRLKG